MYTETVYFQPWWPGLITHRSRTTEILGKGRTIIVQQCQKMNLNSFTTRQTDQVTNNHNFQRRGGLWYLETKYLIAADACQQTSPGDTPLPMQKICRSRPQMQILCGSAPLSLIPRFVSYICVIRFPMGPIY